MITHHCDAFPGSDLYVPPSSIHRAPDPDQVPETFAAFLREERGPLYAFLRRRGASTEDAEDIAQDCMERLIRYQAHGTTELRQLLYRIACNRLADRWRRTPIDTHQALAEDGAANELPCTAPGPLRQAESGQMLALLRQALFKLPDRCREVYLLNRLSGMSYTQIARHCGITANTVEKHIARALQGLRKELGPDSFRKDGET